MSNPAPDPASSSRRPPLVLVVDTGVYVSAAISGQGPPAQLIQAAVEGRVVLLLSALLLSELREVLERPKFSWRLTPDDIEGFLDALVLLGEPVQDPPADQRPRSCRDPDDDYLVALLEQTDAHVLVSGDKDLLELHRPGVDVRTARQVLDMLSYQHPWGPALIPGDDAAAWSQATAEGHDQVIAVASAFLTALDDPNVVELMAHLTTPESLPAWLDDLPGTRELVAGRGMTFRAEYPASDVAYVKLPPDPGETIRSTGDVLLPADTIIMTLQRRPEVPHPTGTGGWRVHRVGQPGALDELPPSAAPGAPGALGS